jgi:acylphosphatase
MLKEIKCIITGKVQAVLFRDFTRENAASLGLAGEVENLSDGSVRVIAQGDEGKLKELIGLLKEGSRFARVDDVMVEWRKPSEKFEGFNVRY